MPHTQYKNIQKRQIHFKIKNQFMYGNELTIKGKGKPFSREIYYGGKEKCLLDTLVNPDLLLVCCATHRKISESKIST